MTLTAPTKQLQEHFASRGYEHVTVYCMARCRNNSGSWPTRHISAPAARKDFAYYAAKDLAVAQDAKCGIMLWDGKSKGTLNNVEELPFLRDALAGARFEGVQVQYFLAATFF